MQDVALVSLSNVLYRSGFDIDAAVVIHMSLEVSVCEVRVINGSVHISILIYFVC